MNSPLANKEKINMKEYRYFITDNSTYGCLVKGRFNGKEMILLLGNIFSNNKTLSIENVVTLLCSKYGFKVEKNNISKVELNTSPETPYTYYDLIDEFGYCESDGYMYTDIEEFTKLFSDTKSQEIFRSITAFS